MKTLGSGKENDERGNSKGGQETRSLTYMRWEGLQGGNTLFRVRSVTFGEIGLQARASLIHRHGPTGPSRLSVFQGRGTGRVKEV